MIRKKARSLLLPYAFTATIVVFTQIMKNAAKVWLHMESAVPMSESMRNWIIAPFLGSGSRNLHGGGYTLRNGRLNQLVDSPKILVGCAFVWGLYLIPSFLYSHNISLASARLDWGVIDYLCTMAACIAVLGIVKHGVRHPYIPVVKCSGKKFNKIAESNVGMIMITDIRTHAMPHIDRFMRFFGKNSLIVLCFHVFEAQFDGVYEYIIGIFDISAGVLSGIIVYGIKILLMCVAIWAVHRVRFFKMRV